MARIMERRNGTVVGTMTTKKIKKLKGKNLKGF